MLQSTILHGTFYFCKCLVCGLTDVRPDCHRAISISCRLCPYGHTCLRMRPPSTPTSLKGRLLVRSSQQLNTLSSSGCRWRQMSV